MRKLLHGRAAQIGAVALVALAVSIPALALGRSGDVQAAKHKHKTKRGPRGPRGHRGRTGPQGPKGAKGDRGPAGPGPSLAKPGSTHWGVIGRNSFGSPVAQLREGPFGRTSATAAATQAPPYGTGSLYLEVSAPPQNATADKVDFGNETDFAGTSIDGLSHLSYWVFADEDSLASHDTPSLSMEAFPDANGKTYTSLVYVPDGSSSPSAPSSPTPDRWQQYDAMAGGNQWYSTTDLDTSTDECSQSNFCTWDELKQQLGASAQITLSLGIAKGRDNAFTGAIDGLRVNNTVYNFEADGVFTRAP